MLLVAPSMAGIGGQSIQADLIRRRFSDNPLIRIAFQPIDPEFPTRLKAVRRVRFVRTVLNEILFVVQLARAIRRCDIVHVFSASYFSFLLAPVPTVLLARLFGKPIILNYHSGEASDHLTRWPSAVRTLRKVDRIAVPSAYLVDVFARFGLRAQAVFNAVDLSSFRYRQRRALSPTFLCNRNFQKHYDVATVLKAFALIRREFPDARLSLAGVGPEEGNLRRITRELGLESVTFLGRVEPAAMPALYDNHDIWINASRVDNMPLSILEAFASGLVVISSAAGGIPYLVRDGATGLLVPCGDAEALSKAAIDVLRDVDRQSRLTEEAAGECRRYEWDNVGPAWSSMYREVVSAAADRRAR